MVLRKMGGGGTPCSNCSLKPSFESSLFSSLCTCTFRILPLQPLRTRVCHPIANKLYPEEFLSSLQHGESLKSKTLLFLLLILFCGVPKNCSQLMIMISSSIKIIIIPCSYCAPFVPPNLL